MLFKRSSSGAAKLDFRTPKGFEQLYHLYAAQMFVICHNKIVDKEIAKEIVQDVFKSLWERRNELSIKGPIEHYLLRATKLEVIDYFRQKVRDSRHMECALEDYCGAECCTEEALGFEELLYTVNTLVDTLPCKCKQVYKLSREKGLTNKEIASALLITEKTVESHITKALSFLKNHLSEYSI